MTQMGWIIVLLVASLAIIAAIILLRRKPGTAPVAIEPAAESLLPEQLPAEAVEPVLSPVAAEAIAHEGVEIVTQPIPPAIPPETQAPAPALSEDGDNLLKLKGVGPKIATLLSAEGITRYAQIAAWSDADIAAIDARLGSFAGRPRRDNWVDQARYLSAGDIAGYEAKYGKL